MVAATWLGSVLAAVCGADRSGAELGWRVGGTVPVAPEAGGVWGPAARKFFRECIALADDDRDIDLYHWSSTRFSRAWFDSLSVLVARGRAKVSAAAAASDWPKRIRDMQYMDVDDSD